MISARGRARTRRYLLIGLMLSLMVHLAGGSLYGLLARVVVKALPQLASKQSQQLPKSDIIRLEKAEPQERPVAVVLPHPKPPKPPPPPPPAPRVEPQPVVAPVEQHHELAHITVHAPRQTAPSRGEGVAEIPHEIRPAAAPPEPKRQAYSQEQLDQLNSQFSQSIEQSHQTLAQANAAMDTAPVITTKHFQMQFNGIHEGMNPGDGIITFTHYERRGNIIYYWTHYEYMYGDGHVEEDDIPWPFHYAIRDDPFARGDRRIPLQPPPADYKPDRPLKPILMQYFGGPQVG
jgi:hypothetical protein